ncbi:MAG: hypothetical protein R2798_11735 [Chitinophagales bacterium]|nr:hypothetical protein [Bacteroidota bacterium]MCB9042571.1 hypothetical protein [Chitinophagales bacterium]
MQSLDKNWVTTGLIDFEYKKYVLLAYLQYVSKQFDENKLYPFLSDLIAHHQNLVLLQQSRAQMQDNFPQKLQKIDVENFALAYEKMLEDEALMIELMQIVHYAIPRLEENMHTGKVIFENIDQKLQIEPIGIVPLHKQTGYMLLQNGEPTSVFVYRYEVSIFERASERFRAIHTHFVETLSRKLTESYESLKWNLIKTHKMLPNPATFLIYSPKKYPFQESLLPVAKRSLVRYLATL